MPGKNVVHAWTEPEDFDGKIPNRPQNSAQDHLEAQVTNVQEFRLPRSASDLIRHFETAPTGS
jgi:hypothetical protein